MSDHNQIAQTIVSQLGGMSRLRAMLGTKQFVGLEKGLRFTFSAKAKNKANMVEIELDNRDLYTVRFYRVRSLDAVPVGRGLASVSVEQLKPAIEAELGLALSF